MPEKYITEIRYIKEEPRGEAFCREIEKSITRLKKEIAEKKEILVAPEKLAEKLGIVTQRHPTSIYWDTKRCLWGKGIFVTSRKTNGKMTVIRTRRPEDELPIPVKKI